MAVDLLVSLVGAAGPARLQAAASAGLLGVTTRILAVGLVIKLGQDTLDELADDGGRIVCLRGGKAGVSPAEEVQ